MHCPCEFAAHRTHDAAEILNGAQQVFSGLMNANPLVGQGETLAAPFAQPHAEAPFKLGNVVADGSRRNPKLVLCCGKALMAHHGLKDAEQPQVGRGKRRFGQP